MRDALHAHGYAQAPAEALIDQALLEEVRATVTTLPRPAPSALKPYLIPWLGRFPSYVPDSVWARVARVLEPIARDYLNGVPRLHHYNLWESLVTAQPPVSSQLWHRDTEDTSLLKAFLYLSDVTEDAGPLHYIPGTHWRGPRRIQPAISREAFAGAAVPRATDEQMAAVVPREDWVVATGPAGTLVLADTIGWHKGGHATGRSRLVAVWHWTTDACPTRFARVNPWA